MSILKLNEGQTYLKVDEVDYFRLDIDGKCIHFAIKGSYAEYGVTYEGYSLAMKEYYEIVSMDKKVQNDFIEIDNLLIRREILNMFSINRDDLELIIGVSNHKLISVIYKEMSQLEEDYNKLLDGMSSK